MCLTRIRRSKWGDQREYRGFDFVGRRVNQRLFLEIVPSKIWEI